MPFNEKVILDEQWLFTVIILAVGAFIALTLSMHKGYLAQFDENVLHWFHKRKNRTLDGFFSSITWLGSLWILLPLYIVLILTFSHYFENVEKFLGIGFWGAFLTTYVLKFVFNRKRPYFFPIINELPIDPSFPSAHTSQIVTFTLLFWFINYNGGSLFDTLFTGVLLFIASGVALSRMYLQVHFPTDVFAGTLVAIVWSSIAILVIKSGGLV